MIDFFIGIAAGYFLRSLLVQKLQHDMLPSWDPNSLGWRSVPPGSQLLPGKRYIAAIEIETKKEVQ